MPGYVCQWIWQGKLQYQNIWKIWIFSGKNHRIFKYSFEHVSVFRIYSNICSGPFFSQPSPKAGRELQTVLNTMMRDEGPLAKNKPEPVTGPWVYTETVYLFNIRSSLTQGPGTHRTGKCRERQDSFFVHCCTIDGGGQPQEKWNVTLWQWYDIWFALEWSTQW